MMMIERPGQRSPPPPPPPPPPPWRWCWLCTFTRHDRFKLGQTNGSLSLDNRTAHLPYDFSPKMVRKEHPLLYAIAGFQFSVIVVWALFINFQSACFALPIPPQTKTFFFLFDVLVSLLPCVKASTFYLCFGDPWETCNQAPPTSVYCAVLTFCYGNVEVLWGSLCCGGSL